MDAKKKKKILTIVGGLVLYLASSGLSWAAFRYLAEPAGSDLITPVAVEEARAKVDLSAPKTEICPLNGKYFTKGEKDIWGKRRPLGVMIENHEESRPQSGLSKADVVYEAVAEGGITRFLAIYYCGASAWDVIVGPVRSSRIYFLDFISEYGDYPLYAHVGGANDFAGSGMTDPKARALEKIASLGWQLYNDMDQSSLSFPTYWRDKERLGRPVATEHTVYSSTDKLWEKAAERGLTVYDDEKNRWDDNFVSWKFKKEAAADERGSVSEIKFDFWEGYQEYAVNWRYSKEENRYLRFNGGQPHKDLNTDEQLKAGVVITQFMRETGPIDANKHLLYATTGTGKVIIFQDGQAIKANWSKKDRESRTKFIDSKGKEIELSPGPIWIEIVPLGNEVEY